MKPLAVVLNIVLLVAVGWLLSRYGAPRDDERWVVVVMIAAPIATLAWAYLDSERGWLALYLRRRALEEQRKIDEMTKGAGGQ